MAELGVSISVRVLLLLQASILEEGEENYLLTQMPEDNAPLFILLAVTEGDKATFGVFKVDTGPCGEELDLCGAKWTKCHAKAVFC